MNRLMTSSLRVAAESSRTLREQFVFRMTKDGLGMDDARVVADTTIQQLSKTHLHIEVNWDSKAIGQPDSFFESMYPFFQYNAYELLVRSNGRKDLIEKFTVKPTV